MQPGSLTSSWELPAGMRDNSELTMTEVLDVLADAVDNLLITRHHFHRDLHEVGFAKFVFEVDDDCVLAGFAAEEVDGVEVAVGFGVVGGDDHV